MPYIQKKNRRIVRLLYKLFRWEWLFRLGYTKVSMEDYFG